MASLLQQEMADDLAEITEEIGTGVVVWGAITYTGAIVADVPVKADLETGGQLATGEKSVKIRRAAYETFPPHGARVTLDGDVGYVSALQNKAGSPWFAFTFSV